MIEDAASILSTSLLVFPRTLAPDLTGKSHRRTKASNYLRKSSIWAEAAEEHPLSVADQFEEHQPTCFRLFLPSKS